MILPTILFVYKDNIFSDNSPVVFSFDASINSGHSDLQSMHFIQAKTRSVIEENNSNLV